MSQASVAFAACPGYGVPLPAALDSAVGALGGWATLVKPGQRVLVKPNLLADAAPTKAVTTHPEFVRHVVRALKRADAAVEVGDSPASAMSLDRVWQVTGIQQVCREEQVPLVSFERGSTRTVRRDGFTFAVAEAAWRADLIVNLPKVKTHALTTFTAAVKNFYGLLPGYQKALLHRANPRPAQFCRLLRALHAALPPSLSIADGIVGMEGEGPANGDPVQLNFLAASRDAVALDLALCRALRIDPRRVPYLATDAARLEDGSIPMLGPRPEVASFRAPAGSGHVLRRVPEPLLRMVLPLVWVRPAFTRNCRFCGRCVAACPAHALAARRDAAPRLTPRRCIACCCCHEVCPARAVRMRRSPLLRLAGVFKDLG